MAVLRLLGVSKEFQNQVLFDGLWLDLESDDRLGIIGVNGCGKSTLLRIMAGLEECDRGECLVAAARRVTYLSQNPPLPDEMTVLEAVHGSHHELLALHEEYQRECQRMAAGDPQGDLTRLARLTEELERLGFYELETRARTAITSLGIDSPEALVGTLSGGQRRRVALAQALTAQPDVLLLDEPTNHLDTASIEWLEGYLRHYPGAVVMVTHDRYFLDRVSRRNLELDNGRATMYPGGYADYLQRKAELAEQERSREERRANLLRRELEWLGRGPRARATKQKARQERALALLAEEREGPAQRLEIGLASRRLGHKVIELEGITQKFGDRTLIRDLDFTFNRGDRVGVIGPNGCGKTTLLEIVSGRLQSTGGRVETGPTVKLGYLDQETRDLNPDLKVLDTVREVAEQIPTQDGRVLTASQMLERFLFPGRLQHTVVGRLSGGERRRLVLLMVLMENPNFLILDEPTNDLDIPTLNCLEDYLDSFPGCLLISSHDRYLLDRTVDRLLAFEGEGRVREWPGSFSDYWESRPAPERPAPSPAPVAAAAPVPAPPERKKKLSFKEQREFTELEAAIARDESRQKELESELASGSSDAASVHRAYCELETLKKTLERNVERWAELAEYA